MAITQSKLTDIFDASGLSKRAFASAIGVSDTAVGRWLKGGPVAPDSERRIRAFAMSTALPALTPHYAAPTPLAGIGVPVMSNDRVAIIGASGSGKTWLVTHMLPRVPAFVVLTADDASVPDSVTAMLPDIPVTTSFDASLPRQIVCIPDTFARDEAKWQAWDTVQRAIFRAGNCIIYYDELTAIAPGTNARAPFTEIVTQGRKRNIGVWVGMQRPRGVARIALSQAEHFLALSTTDPEDRTYIGEFIGRAYTGEIPRINRAVLYCNVKEQWTRYWDMDAERAARDTEAARIPPQTAQPEYPASASKVARAITAPVLTRLPPPVPALPPGTVSEDGSVLHTIVAGAGHTANNTRVARGQTKGRSIPANGISERARTEIMRNVLGSVSTDTFTELRQAGLIPDYTSRGHPPTPRLRQLPDGAGIGDSDDDTPPVRDTARVRRS